MNILDYWVQRNKSKRYSQKLDKLFDRVVELTAKNPESGKTTDYKNIRIRIVRHYLIFYLIHENHIEVIRIWDARRDSGNLNLGET
ncbi:hypothetical protein BH24BAC1_BH24BAC1_41140 [soil metagenome]